ncbi:hypothetical protein HNY73_009509 [Argiope bruennichi]|uniref:Uncharacterized protein n=1 Tax=Argiope bruennichi TaxID=94029 RepID=A0A8T0FCA6_ARGBR|nr:hypothetical protein HNY73_009509 [Argiope bruennichi]
MLRRTAPKFVLKKTGHKRKGESTQQMATYLPAEKSIDTVLCDYGEDGGGDCNKYVLNPLDIGGVERSHVLRRQLNLTGPADYTIDISGLFRNMQVSKFNEKPKFQQIAHNPSKHLNLANGT